MYRSFVARLANTNEMQIEYLYLYICVTHILYRFIPFQFQADNNCIAHNFFSRLFLIFCFCAHVFCVFHFFRKKKVKCAKKTNNKCKCVFLVLTKSISVSPKFGIAFAHACTMHIYKEIVNVVKIFLLLVTNLVKKQQNNKIVPSKK